MKLNNLSLTQKFPDSDTSKIQALYSWKYPEDTIKNIRSACYSAAGGWDPILTSYVAGSTAL